MNVEFPWQKFIKMPFYFSEAFLFSDGPWVLFSQTSHARKDRQQELLINFCCRTQRDYGRRFENDNFRFEISF